MPQCPYNPIGEDIFTTREKNTGHAFKRLGKVLWKTFLPRLFFGRMKTLPIVVQALSTVQVKKSGMGLNNPVTSAAEKYNSLLRASCKLIDALKCKR